jgi:hypothetical protein
MALKMHTKTIEIEGHKFSWSIIYFLLFANKIDFTIHCRYYVTTIPIISFKNWVHDQEREREYSLLISFSTYAIDALIMLYKLLIRVI